MARKQREQPKLQGDTSPIAEKTTGPAEEKARALMRKVGHAPGRVVDIRKRKGSVGRPQDSELAIECAYCGLRVVSSASTAPKCPVKRPVFGGGRDPNIAFGERKKQPDGLANLVDDIEWKDE